jgi:hypothetical protein
VSYLHGLDVSVCRTHVQCCVSTLLGCHPNGVSSGREKNFAHARSVGQRKAHREVRTLRVHVNLFEPFDVFDAALDPLHVTVACSCVQNSPPHFSLLHTLIIFSTWRPDQMNSMCVHVWRGRIHSANHVQIRARRPKRADSQRKERCTYIVQRSTISPLVCHKIDFFDIRPLARLASCVQFFWSKTLYAIAYIHTCNQAVYQGIQIFGGHFSHDRGDTGSRLLHKTSSPKTHGRCSKPCIPAMTRRSLPHQSMIKEA